MKLLITSDLHGGADAVRTLAKRIEEFSPDKILLLGDLLYHGPRNDLPQGYAPKQVIPILNGLKDKVIAVRGNCEAEVDQMVLGFPCMADHNVLIDPAADNKTLFFTHGHVYGPGLHNSVDSWPALPANSALVYGHTHKKVLQEVEGHEGVCVFNPGSVGIPKDGTHSFGVYEDGAFEHRLL